ncbi:energy transducer TonB [Dysgonomonas sp. 25]|uniref:energy transducer TonB n=1 Tax=Dysgonomonas sp. 25 TaxID=2302933 RepID=UPI0013D4DD9E|nr:energy transducer TonB [Dysgonomonas sp. 25]NDV67594.1 energy transducer TonB [Dysgonomonas sp. 25]
MKKYMNIESSEWCDMVFDKRNKAYGAYALRQSSTKRHLLAFGVVFLFAIAIAVLPMLVSTIKAATTKYVSGIDEPRIMTDVVIEPPVVDIPEPEMEQPKMKVEIAKTIAFTPPRIVENVDPDKEMKPQSTIKEFGGLVGKVNVLDGSTSKFAIDPSTLKENLAVTKEPEKKIHDFVETMPVFPGGETEMNRYLRKNVNYPMDAQEQGIHGRVTVRFVVDKNGNISNVTVLKGINPSCDREAVRVVKSMPKWIPGRQNGNAVAVYFNLPIVFRLQ